VARLLGATPRQASRRAIELITAFDLGAVAYRPARTYSGGMRRRLDLAVSLVGSPEVLFLDEPSTGLDPVSRAGLWEIVSGLAAGGTTIVLTTQYLEEADRLADEVVVLGLGRVVLSGEPERLKAGLGSKTATLRFGTLQAADQVLTALAGLALRATQSGCDIVVALTKPSDVAVLVRVADAEGVELLDLKVTEPTLDDVYLAVHQSMVERS
jgi:ABC-2 type transport system ATP-binding protein